MTSVLTPTPTTKVADFKGWLRDYTLAELSNGDAAKQYVATLYEIGDTDTLMFAAQQYFTQVAAVTQRAQTKQIERVSYGGVKPTIAQQKADDIFDYVRNKDFNIPSPEPRPGARKTSAQKHAEAMNHRANMRATLKARLELDAEKMQANIDIQSDALLDSKVKVTGLNVSYRDLTSDIADERFAPLFAAMAGDYEGLVYLKAISLILHEFPGKTLGEVASLSR